MPTLASWLLGLLAIWVLSALVIGALSGHTLIETAQIVWWGMTHPDKVIKGENPDD